MIAATRSRPEAFSFCASFDGLLAPPTPLANLFSSFLMVVRSSTNERWEFLFEIGDFLR